MSIQKQTWTLIQVDLCKNQTEIILKDEEHHYVFHVLRLKEGDSVELTNCNGLTAIGNIISINKKSITIEIKNYSEHKKNSPIIHLWLAYPKPATLEEVVASASELGADHIHIFKADKSAVKSAIKIEKITKISQEAVRISKSAYAANISCYNNLNEFYQKNIEQNERKRLILFCDESHVYEGKIKNSIYTIIREQYKNSTEEICILIGPEASFSDMERSFIYEKITTHAVSLGNNILRVPNAVISALGTVINFRNDTLNFR
ncbi:RsmE family RNA methyltransferase [Fluviispira multicolorata]|uniref:Ribosomal RNA small subunit methyltransferase E n=1 Tax=Fluviispira multicolorata TaxID=2654512 RepID=A0A833JAS3_9BACT|nr:RsmE family RNA methyltransferase [Fluviispira multicolorata]KAB8028131.1 RsmE family RNA methyltransferase [Fluviispira multicolorata]